ncbi:PIN domain-containing protein [Bifidobacterium leontopitheci]|uniref:PIN domain-containing protein n=1 Tax=Bifidobacterium leontopitheci TaxID=2650774 RepID=A0A6I1GH71_9BIFI|nr:PIN domain-containing protein [Bifidobacterium leontopitheci]KAB7789026.1 PIN domain-containing protein [Bifidobacterium leontopitheci]
MAKPVVLLDANVFPAVWLLDIMLTLDEEQVIDAAWSERILEEARRTLIERRNRTPEQADRLLSFITPMNPTHCVYGWEHLEAAFDLPDPDDRHVLAAALSAGADYIVTYNLKDFPPRSLERYAVEAMHPDEFLSMMLKRDQAGVVNAMNAVVSSKDNPPRTMTEELAHLRKLRLNGFADGMERIAC